MLLDTVNPVNGPPKKNRFSSMKTLRMPNRRRLFTRLSFFGCFFRRSPGHDVRRGSLFHRFWGSIIVAAAAAAAAAADDVGDIVVVVVVFTLQSFRFDVGDFLHHKPPPHVRECEKKTVYPSGCCFFVKDRLM